MLLGVLDTARYRRFKKKSNYWIWLRLAGSTLYSDATPLQTNLARKKVKALASA